MYQCLFDFISISKYLILFSGPTLTQTYQELLLMKMDKVWTLWLDFPAAVQLQNMCVLVAELLCANSVVQQKMVTRDSVTNVQKYWEMITKKLRIIIKLMKLLKTQESIDIFTFILTSTFGSLF